MNVKIYEYSRKVKVASKLIEEKKDYKLFELSYKSPYRTPYEENNTIYSFCYEPKPRKKGLALIVLHGLRERNAWFEKMLCRILAKNKFTAILMTLPYHLKRTPEGSWSGAYFFSKDLRRSGNAYRQAVIDARCTADWLEEQGLKIGIIGISMGAILANTTMGVDERFKVGISITGGGNINRMIWEGIFGWIIKLFLISKGATERHYRETIEDFKKFLHKIKEGAKIPEPKWEWYLLDPLTYAHRNYPRNVLMINGIFDLIIPRPCVQELNTALGNPEIIWLPCSHFTIYIFSPYILKKSLEYLNKFS